ALANDTQAVLPADYTFTTADAGTHTFSTTLFKTAGASSPFILVMDAVNHVSSVANLVVTPLAASSLTVSGLSSQAIAAGWGSVTVTALDVFGNGATGYTGTVQFSSSDPRAAFPADYTFTAGDQGTHTFVVTFKSPGTQSIRVTDTTNPALTSTESGIAVSPG